MNRDELLTKLAMELPKWPKNKHYMQWDGYDFYATGYCDSSPFSKMEWLQRRQELINCPPDSESPKWAEWRAQDADGWWCWFAGKPAVAGIAWHYDEEPHQARVWKNGKTPNGHRWQDTLTRINREDARYESVTGVKHRINRDDNTSAPEEDEEFERIQARQAADKPHEEDARMLDAQLHESVNSVNVSGTKHRISTGYLDAQLNDDIAKFREVFTMNDGEIPEGLKYDQEKPRLDLLINDMPLALEEIAAVLTYGANKYAPGNWMHVDNAEDRYLAAQMRHELSYARGNEVDGETHLHELAHSACCALFRLELALRNR